ncbi:small nuclear RNA activating complex, subunit SNAP43-domain-containing protein [Helicostylum pulchrum]|nr:small nuclear RNA activating complex, subunit SNAP43-domain-containing protein [Helicostylum pulchrum]
MGNPGRCRFPKTSLKAVNLVSVEKTAGILKDAIDDDVEYLLVQFRSKPNYGFEDFDNVWNELHFSLVHFACVKRSFRATFMDAFYSSVLDFIHSPSPIFKSGAIFALYFLYISQPAIWGKNRIRVSTETWKLLFNFYVDSIKNDTNIEAALIFDKLRKLGAFIFVENEKINRYLLQESIEFERAIKMLDELHQVRVQRIKNEAIDLCINSRLSSIEQTAEEYQRLKKETFYTPQATIATQRHLKETLNVTENRTRLLQNVLLNSTLANDETKTMKRMKGLHQQMWNSKRRKLEDEKKEE